jgi:hypothetical protein
MHKRHLDISYVFFIPLQFFQVVVSGVPCIKLFKSFFPPCQLEFADRFRLWFSIRRSCGNGLTGSSAIGEVFPFRLWELGQCVEFYPFVETGAANPVEYIPEKSPTRL